MTQLPEVQALVPKAREAFDDPDYIFEPKYHGFRAILRFTEESAYFQSKTGRHMDRFDWLAKDLQKHLRARSGIIDGEITVLDPIRGHPQFLPLLQNEKTQMIYVVYDLLYLNGRDLRFWPLMRRKPKLAQLMRGVPKTLVIDYWEGSGKLYFQWICSQDLEGLVAKRRTDPYTERTIWYKVKNKNYSQRNVGRILNKKSRAK